MGCAQSKPMCQCFGKKKNVPEVYRIPSCTTEASLESLEREILRFKARQQQAARRRSNFSLAKQSTESQHSMPKIPSPIKLATFRSDVLAKEQLFPKTEKTNEKQHVIQIVSAIADKKEEDIPSVVSELPHEVVQTVSDNAEKIEEDFPSVVSELVDEVVQTVSAIADKKEEDTPSVVFDLVEEVVQTVSAVAEKKEEDTPSVVFDLVEEVVQTVSAVAEKKEGVIHPVISELVDEVVQTVSAIADKKEEDTPSVISELIDEVSQTVSANADKKEEDIPSVISELVEKVVQTVSANAEKREEDTPSVVFDNAEQDVEVISSVISELVEEVVQTVSDNSNKKEEDIPSVVSKLVEEVVQTVTDNAEQDVEDFPSVISELVDEVVQTVSANDDKKEEVTPSVVSELVDEVVQTVSATADKKEEDILSAIAESVNTYHVLEHMPLAVTAAVEEVVQTVSNKAVKNLDDIPPSVAALVKEVVQIVSVAEHEVEASSGEDDSNLVPGKSKADVQAIRKQKFCYKEVAETWRPDHTFHPIFLNQVTGRCLDFTQRDILSHPLSRRERLSLVSSVLDDSDVQELVVYPQHDDDETLYLGTQVKRMKECNVSTQNAHATDVPSNGISSSTSVVKETDKTPDVSKSDVHVIKDIHSVTTVLAVKEEAPENLCSKYANESKAELKRMTVNGDNASASNKKMLSCEDEEQPPNTQLLDLNKHVVKKRIPDPKFQAIFMNQVTGQCLDFTDRDVLRHPLSHRERLSLVSSVLDASDIHELVLHPEHDDDETLYQGTTRVETSYPQALEKAKQVGDKTKDNSIFKGGKESSNQLFTKIMTALPALPFNGAAKLSKGPTKSRGEYTLTNDEQQNQGCGLTMSSSDEILQQSSHDTLKRMPRKKLKVDDEIEAQKIKATMMEINKHRGISQLSPVSTSFVVKFLKAKKFDVDDAVELYHHYMMQKKLYFVSNSSPIRNPLKAELLSGRFTILDKRDGNGTAIAVFTAQRNSREQNHRVVLTNIYLQLNEALKSPQTQTNGMMLLYDFSNTSYLTSDSQLCINIVNLLKDAYPVRLIKTFIISPPFWIESELKFCSKLLLGTNREKILFVSRSGLKNHLCLECIPQGLGGKLHVDYMSWIDQCILGYSEQLVKEPIMKPRYGNYKG